MGWVMGIENAGKMVPNMSVFNVYNSVSIMCTRYSIYLRVKVLSD